MWRQSVVSHIRRLLALLLVLAASRAAAHPLAPALLELRELGGGRVGVTWKTSRYSAPGVAMAPILPAACRAESAPTATVEADSVTQTWTVLCDPGGLVGARVGVSGLSEARVDALIRVTMADGRLIRAIVRAASPLLTIPVRPQPLDVVRAYVVIGIEHILTGVDHLLFVAGLVLLVGAGMPLLRVLTAFIVGHSITLSLAGLDLLRVPSRPTELLIAVSVFWLAVELAREPAERPAWLRNRAWVMALALGLLHGFGFASALREVGLPQGEAALALCSFNVGIELGQLAFVALLLIATAALRAVRVTWPRWAQLIPLYTMGSLAAFWCLERAAALID
jgi:hypothetical protein